MDRDWTARDHRIAKYYDDTSSFTLQDAACLWEGVWPEDYKANLPVWDEFAVEICDNQKKSFDEYQMEAMQEHPHFYCVPLAIRMLAKLIDTHKILCGNMNHYDNGDVFSDHFINAYSRKCMVSRSDLEGLATSKEYFPFTLFPEKRPKIIEEEKNAIHLSSSPAYLDKTHSNFAPELEAAASAWNALFAEGGYRQNRGVKEQIRDWLDKNRNTLSDRAKERISVVCNPNKSGGAPTSEK